MKIAIATCSILLALAGSASAQPGLTPPVAPEEEPPPPARAPAPVGEPLSESAALTLSLGGTLGSWGLLIGAGYFAGGSETLGGLAGTAGAFGIVLGPSFGHWYADKYFTRGLTMRLLSGVVMMIGAVVALTEDPISFGHDDVESSGDPVVGPAILIAGAGLFVAGTVDDILTAPRRVRRLNQERAGLAIAPIVTPGSTGLALTGRF